MKAAEVGAAAASTATATATEERKPDEVAVVAEEVKAVAEAAELQTAAMDVKFEEQLATEVQTITVTSAAPEPGRMCGFCA